MRWRKRESKLNTWNEEIKSKHVKKRNDVN